MLVLTRRDGESVLIDKGRIRIQVLYRRNGRMALGITAPLDVEVDREEIFLKKQIENAHKRPAQQGHADANAN